MRANPSDSDLAAGTGTWCASDTTRPYGRTTSPNCLSYRQLLTGHDFVQPPFAVGATPSAWQTADVSSRGVAPAVR